MKSDEKSILIDALKIPDFGWQKSVDDAQMKQWENPKEEACLSLHFFDKEPDLVSVLDINALRYSFRDSIQPMKGGLIEVNVVDVKGFEAVRFIFKVPKASGHGMDYRGSLIIPFESYSYVVKIQADEVGMTGMRDNIIGMKWTHTNTGKNLTSRGAAGWLRDPYHPELTSGTLMNASDEAGYDTDFPNHPLSRVRKVLQQVEAKLEFAPELQRLPKFYR